jgi:primosomal protein N'
MFCKSCKHEEILNTTKNLRCENCGSYKLYDFGIGVQKVYEFLENIFPNLNLKVDESTKKISEIEIQKTVAKYYSGNELNLVGSIRTANSILKNIDSVFIVSLGPLISSDKFYFDEEIIAQLSMFEGITGEIFIQQHSENEVVWDRYKNKDKFYEEELKNRKLVNLPPFAKIINFSLDYKNRKILDNLSFRDRIQNLNFKKGRVNFYIIGNNPEDILEEIKINRNIFDIKISNTIENPSFWK